MAQSAIRYRDNTQYIQDALLGEALKYIFIALDRKVSENSRQYGWLLQAMNKWWDDFEHLPPGLKDIELDEWLDNSKRKSDFEEILSLSLDNVNTELLIEIMKFKRVIDMNPHEYDEFKDIDNRVLKGEKVPCPTCGEILIYQGPDTGKHPSIICPNHDYSVLLEVQRVDILDKLGLRKRKGSS
ncbi:MULTISPECIES: hypothetical protein [Paenibacillus]|uniref:hypothetical protein n=1 Tax=Paenibacillus TaxID=44249 RepID=UPI002FDFB39D